MGREHSDTLTALSNLAAVYYALGRYADSERLLKHVLNVREHVLGHSDPLTLLSVVNLATLYNELGRYREAEPLYERALAGSPVPEHPFTIRSERLSSGHVFCTWRLSTS